jgi:hypothetical protein
MGIEEASPMEPLIAKAKAEVDARSMELFEEFREHYQNFAQLHPGIADVVDRHIVFEGWVLQKVAGLQLSIEALAQRLEATGASEG